MLYKPEIYNKSAHVWLFCTLCSMTYNVADNLLAIDSYLTEHNVKNDQPILLREETRECVLHQCTCPFVLPFNKFLSAEKPDACKLHLLPVH